MEERMEEEMKEVDMVVEVEVEVHKRCGVGLRKSDRSKVTVWCVEEEERRSRVGHGEGVWWWRGSERRHASNVSVKLDGSVVAGAAASAAMTASTLVLSPQSAYPPIGCPKRRQLPSAMAAKSTGLASSAFCPDARGPTAR